MPAFSFTVSSILHYNQVEIEVVAPKDFQQELEYCSKTGGGGWRGVQVSYSAAAFKWCFVMQICHLFLLVSSLLNTRRMRAVHWNYLHAAVWVTPLHAALQDMPLRNNSADLTGGVWVDFSELSALIRT